MEDDPHDRNPNNHTPQDTIDLVNQEYLINQIKATIKIAEYLLISE